MTEKEIKKPTGTRDFFGDLEDLFGQFEKVSQRIAEEYNFERIRTPILEEEDLFNISVGEDTDIVQKEMFSLETKGGSKLTLRPEGTASVVRSYIENDLYKKPQPVKFYYSGPFFRYERPQKGRYRQFHQFGLEVLGIESSALDSQVIKVFHQILNALNIDSFVRVNSLGDAESREEYIKALKSFLKVNRENLCKNCIERMDKNTLRVLDCKEDSCQKVLEKAPKINDYLSQSSKKRFKEVLSFLKGMNIPYEEDPFLVRGLDYYNNTVFEFFCKEEDFALGGGGRYDKLVETLGGRVTPAAGGALGIDRVLEVMSKKGFKKENKEKKIFLAQLGSSAKKKAFDLFEKFREEGIPVYESMGRDSLKSQMSRADKLGADLTLIIGKRECINNEVMIREMKTGKQETVKMDNIVEEIKKRI